MKFTVGLLAVLGMLSWAATQPSGATPTLEIKTVSADPARVTGGNVLVKIVASPALFANGALSVKVNGREQTSAFRPDSASHAWLGLVTGLNTGDNRIEVSAGSPATRSALTVTNYPITGPVFSGPWLQPFICQTDQFSLPDGTKLGPPLDANCSARTVVQYVYRSTTPPADPKEPQFKPLPSLSTLPPDVAKTTTTAGETVNFVVRVETGTINRGIYQNVILHDPTVEGPVSPFSPPKGWNRRLIAMHGVGCASGWYIQGAAQGVSIFDPSRLGQGYALFINTLNHPTNSCNAVLAGETTMMGKEHFIETFGEPFYTISWGRSGGAYTSLQVADAYPGLIDGVEIILTFPDALSIALAGLDGRLLTHYFATATQDLTEEQKVAITGYHSMKAFVDAANQSQRTDPVPNRVDNAGYQSARWNAAVPAELRYDPVTNPKGARPTVFDVARNVYGMNPSTGAALRPFDNVGVQYGLSALNAGVITVKQFLDLNEQIGGYDQDANYVKVRSIGDSGAIKRAHQSGLLLGANGGLSSIPIVDDATSNETERYHYGWFHYALRERLREGNGGDSSNMVMWRSTVGTATRDLLDKWMVAYKSDTSPDPQRVKVLRAKPKEGVEGCYDKSTPPQFIAEALVFSSRPVSKCSELYPVYSNVRKEAGGPLAANNLKCQLKPVDQKDYKVTFSGAELSRLKAVFTGGVCDWSKAGVNQTPVVTWASFGPSPKNLVFRLEPVAQRSR